MAFLSLQEIGIMSAECLSEMRPSVKGLPCLLSLFTVGQRERRIFRSCLFFCVWESSSHCCSLVHRPNIGIQCFTSICSVSGPSSQVASI